MDSETVLPRDPSPVSRLPSGNRDYHAPCENRDYIAGTGTTTPINSGFDDAAGQADADCRVFIS